jgi:hypothetical protein
VFISTFPGWVERKVIEEITNRMRKIAHIPIQTWKGWNPNDLFGGWFSALRGFKTLLEAIIVVSGVCFIVPYLVPLVLQSIRTIIEAPIEFVITWQLPM